MDHIDFIQNATRKLFVHIGKCGGSTVWRSLEKQDALSNFEHYHIRKPEADPDALYYFVMRDPIARAISAFNWSYHTVIERKKQSPKRPKEGQILERYQSLDNLASQLYDENGFLDMAVEMDFSSIIHLPQGIGYYLYDLLDEIEPMQIGGIIFQETLNEDFERVFGFKPSLHRNQNANSDRSKTLSPQAINNLMKIYSNDYEVLTRLYCLGKISRERFTSFFDTDRFLKR